MIAPTITKAKPRHPIALPERRNLAPQADAKPATAITPKQHAQPLAPSDWWDDKETVVWDTAPRSPFAEAVHYLGLTTKLMVDGKIEVELTLDDLMLVIAYTRRYSGDKLPPNPPPTLKAYTFNHAFPTWDDEIPPLPEMEM